MAHECEVCETDYPIATVTFTLDDGSIDPCPVRMCRDCHTAILNVMVERWHASIEEANASMSWLMEQLGIENPFTNEGASE